MSGEQPAESTWSTNALLKIQEMTRGKEVNLGPLL